MAHPFPFPSEPIVPGHGASLQAAFAAAGKRAWCYFAPFICCYSLPPGRVVHIGDVGGSQVLVVTADGKRGRRADLLVPPVPMDSGVLEEAMAALASLNGDRPPRILWVEKGDAAQLSPERYLVRTKEGEYVYDPSRVAAASGPEYRDLRKRVRQFERGSSGLFRELTTADLPACDALHHHWRQRQGRRHPFLLDWGYTRAALAQYPLWSREALQGWCVEVGGRVAAFAMAGPMLPDQANFFIAKCDPEIHGLSEYLRWKVMGELRGFVRVNDASDLELPGLRQHKRKFRPVEVVEVFKADRVRT